MTAVLQIRSLRGGYTPAPILRGIDLEVGESEIVALFGANGAGKTTLLRAVAGTLPICKGEIEFNGRSIVKMAPWNRVKAGVAMVPEGRRVFAGMTVGQNLDVAALARKTAARKQYVFELFPRLAERAKQLAGSLSGGEQQMLAIGRALMTAPTLLLIDEMSAGLAPVLVHELVAALRQLQSEGLPVLLVEQSPHYVADAVDRVHLLDQGEIVGSGTLEELGGADRLAELYLGVV